jgi:hypothetical protein
MESLSTLRGLMASMHVVLFGLVMRGILGKPLRSEKSFTWILGRLPWQQTLSKRYTKLIRGIPGPIESGETFLAICFSSRGWTFGLRVYGSSETEYTKIDFLPTFCTPVA